MKHHNRLHTPDVDGLAQVVSETKGLAPALDAVADEQPHLRLPGAGERRKAIGSKMIAESIFASGFLDRIREEAVREHEAAKAAAVPGGVTGNDPRALLGLADDEVERVEGRAFGDEA